MTGRRLGYLAVLAGCLVLYLFHGQWLSWMLLMAVVFLPWFSLLVSLPGMLTAELALTVPAAVTLGSSAAVQVWGSARGTMPPFRVKCRQRDGFTEKTEKRAPSQAFTPRHCGKITFSIKKAWVYDYLGLFRFPTRKAKEVSLLVRPVAVVCPTLPPLQRYRARAWRAKPGGGFAENHELRLYRPGDPLNQMHWKLSAKMGQWVLREPMEPCKGRAVLSLELTGTPELLDEKLGKLLYASNYLLEQGIPHEIRALTGDGILVGRAEDAASQTAFLDQLLSARKAGEETLEPMGADWQHHIGGPEYGA